MKANGQTMKAPAAFALCLFLSSFPALPHAFAQKSPASPELEKIRSIAESQHEIVVLLIRKKEYAKAAEEANKIFDLKWPPSEEQVLLKELLFFTDQFLHHDQAVIAVRLLDKNARFFKQTSSQIAILKEKGYLHKSMNQDEEALNCFREASRLEKSHSR